MNFTKLTQPEFTKFERAHPLGNFFQSVSRATLRDKMGYGTHLVGVKEGKKVLAAALIVERDHEGWIQIGPIMDYDDAKLVDFFLTEVVKYARENGLIKLEIFPPLVLSLRELDGSVVKSYDRQKIFDAFSRHGFHHEGFTIKFENKACRWMFVKDLSGMKTLRDAELTMNASTRKKLHKATRELEIHVLKDKSELPEWRTALLDSNKRNGIPTRDVKYFEDLWDAFGENAIFVEARVKDTGELVSSEVDVIHPNEFVAVIAGTIEKNKHYNGSTLIKGWNIEECLKRGLTRLNLYGMDGTFSPDNPLLYFKGGLRGITEEYIGGFEIVLDPVKLYKNKILRRLRRFIKK